MLVLSFPAGTLKQLHVRSQVQGTGQEIIRPGFQVLFILDQALTLSGPNVFPVDVALSVLACALGGEDQIYAASEGVSLEEADGSGPPEHRCL